MKVEEHVSAFAKLGEYFLKIETDANFHEKIISAKKHNGWFTETNVLYALKSLGESLSKEKLEKWITDYTLQSPNLQPLTVGVIMAGNIPCVGFHDFLCVLMSGNIIAMKLSSDDKILMKAVAEKLVDIEPRFSDKIIFTEKMKGMDAVIATGSNNTSRYFEYYFSKYPHIIRKNRSSVAVLSGDETEDQLKGLGKDIFSYFGLGCRNVSKLFVPENYSFNTFFESIYNFNYVIDNKKYANNYDYNRTVYLMNSIPVLDNNFLLLKKDAGYHSPVGVLHYENYADLNSLRERLRMDAAKIQCIVSDSMKEGVPFGKSQCPQVWDYADGTDTIKFLLSL